MWTPTIRRQPSRAGLRPGIDPADAEWAILSPFLQPEATCCRKRAWPMHDVINAIRYVLHCGACGGVRGYDAARIEAPGLSEAVR